MSLPFIHTPAGACDHAHHDFSIAWSAPGAPATKASRPYRTDAEAKRARDAFATLMRKAGHTVRCSSLRAQRREFWGWQEPCGITCTVYTMAVERAEPLAA